MLLIVCTTFCASAEVGLGAWSPGGSFCASARKGAVVKNVTIVRSLMFIEWYSLRVDRAVGVATVVYSSATH
jgi:hypothetical protein